MEILKKRKASRIKGFTGSEGVEKRTIAFREKMSELMKKKVINIKTCETYPSLKNLCDSNSLEIIIMSRKLADFNGIENFTPFRYYKILPQTNSTIFSNVNGDRFKMVMFITIRGIHFSIAEMILTKQRFLLDNQTTLKYTQSLAA